MAGDRQADEQHVTPLLEHLARSSRRAAEGALAESGLRTRHLVALRLFSDSGPLNQQDLAASLSLDPSNVVGLLNDLEERGLVLRRRDPADRRRHIVELSALGAQALDEAQARLRCVEDTVLRALSTQERSALHELLVRAVGASRPTCSVDDEPPCA